MVLMYFHVGLRIEVRSLSIDVKNRLLYSQAEATILGLLASDSHAGLVPRRWPASAVAPRSKRSSV